MRERIVVFDVETTGLDVYRDEIIEFGAWCIEDGQDPIPLHFLVRPSQRVSVHVLHLTGISEDELEIARPLEEYRQEIVDFLRGAVLVGHNILFDLTILGNNLGLEFHNEYWDTLDLARIFFPCMNYYRLGILAERLELTGLDGLQLHRALHDAWLTWQLLDACWQKGLQYDLSLYDKAEYLLDHWGGKGFFSALRREVSRKFPDRPLRTDLGINFPSEGLFAKGSDKDGAVPDQIQWISDCFSPKGKLEQYLEGYESRTGQRTMAEAVAKALAKSQHLVVEAGTGTGKSLAYLIPGIWWAKKIKSKVVVATHTIPLQEQISNKDLPVLQKVLPFSFSSALVKGRGNYCCLKKWLIQLSSRRELNHEEKVASLSILIWLRETKTGDSQELSQWPGLYSIWPTLNAEGESCIPARCPQSGSCFMLKARKTAEDADVLIVNHSLLFADMKTNFSVLPEYSCLIVDEAHHLYETALEQLGDSLNRERMISFLDRLVLKTNTSLFSLLKQRLVHITAASSTTAWELFRKQMDELPGLAESVLEQTQELFQLLETIMGSKQSLRLVSQHQSENWWGVLVTQMENLSGRTKAIETCLNQLCGLLTGEEDVVQEILYELTAYKTQVIAISEGFPHYLDVDNKQRVTWLEKTGTRIVWHTSPVDVCLLLHDKLYERLNSVIMTSATLSVAGTFKHFVDELGLPQDISAISVESPFAYDKQMSFLVVKDIMRSTRDNDTLAARIADFIRDAAQRMQGRTLVLFTSHQLLRLTHTYLQDGLNGLKLNLLGQGFDGSRGTILQEFRRNPESVLLGANSFWEGIDLPGEILRCVIIVKLPFHPPSMPLIEARSELLTLRGANPFQDFLLPQAVLRFKQGFGRLIRTKTDRGYVIVLDERIIEKSYGRLFLKSLPLTMYTQGNAEFILNKLV